jgi:integrase
VDNQASFGISAKPVARYLFADYAVSWWDSIEGLVRPRILEDYTRRLERHVLPLLGERPIDQIQVDDVLALIGGLHGQGCAGSIICSVLMPLSRLFAHAVRRGLIEVEPDQQIRPKRAAACLSPGAAGSQPRRDRALARGRLSPVSHAPRNRNPERVEARRTARSALAGCGLLNQVIHVRSALDRHQRDVPPKTQSALRDVVLMPALAQALKRHRAESLFSAPDDFAFTTRVGTPLPWTNLGPRALKPALKAAGIQALRWHDVRHTFASLLIASGANITFVSRQLGHSSSRVTLSVYAHLLDREEQAERTRQALQEMVGSVV